MYEFKLFSITDRNSRAFPVINYDFLFITCDNNILYALNRRCLGLWSYNLSTNQWVELKFPGKSFHSLHQGSAIGIVKEDNLLKVFSTDKWFRRIEERLHVCNLKTKECIVKILDGFLPMNECSCAMNIFYYNNFYYTVVAEQNSTYDIVLNIFRINEDSCTWELVDKSKEIDSSFPLYSVLGIIYNNDRIYIFSSDDLHRVLTFNLKTICWNFLPTLPCDTFAGKTFPPDRECYSMSQYVDPDSNEKCLIVSGGQNLETFNADTEIWKFNLTTFKWKFLGEFGDLQHKCFFRRWATITPNGKLVTCDESSDDRINKHVFSRKVNTAWTRIPSLVDICWDAVLYYYPDLPNKSKDDIENKFGIPWQFLQMQIK